MTTLCQQVQAFGLTVTLGILMGFLFDFYRVLFQFVRPAKWLTQVADLLFWLVLAAVVFSILLLSNWGEVRAYVFLGLAVGVGVHLRWFSRTTLRCLQRLFRFLITAYNFLINLFIWPVRWLTRIVVVPVGWLSMGVRWLFFPFARALAQGKKLIPKWKRRT